ncbi:hypothetical protein L596_016141 [Steinernema carpocapsae]|uniref:PAZ domain-containing protein n=1 Tax=Steinernema carpocapsae TaxID=34508 RepID=A0A4U5NI28_STECR|nr:hypothetical protein L596_016141 [Steinernema carpocapsae]
MFAFDCLLRVSSSFDAYLMLHPYFRTMETLTKAVANMMPPVNLASKREDAKPNAQERALPLQTNMFSLSMRDEVPVFMYSVDVFMKVRSKAISLVKHSRDDYIVIDRKNKCRAAFRFVVRANPAVFGNPGKIYYDLQAQLFTLEKLNMDNEDEGLELVIDGADARRSTDFAEIPLDGIVVQIKRAGPKFDLALGELQLKFVAQEPKSHELLQFLEVATSQYAFLTPSDFVTYPAGLSFIKQKDPKAGTELEGGKLLLDGAQKSVRLIEGEKKTDGGGKLAVIVDAKKTAFHKTYQKVIEKVNDFGFLQSDGTVHRMRIPDLAKLLKHIYVESRYRKRTQRFLINDVNPDNARNKMFTRNGVMISVEQYYREVYNITLRYPLAPLIVSKPMKSKDSEEKMVCLFPMEVLFVCPDQRVKINQQTPRQISDMIKRCAMQPDVRVKETKNYAEKLQLNGPASQACLNYAGVSIANEVVKVSGRKLVAPEIQYKDKKIAVDSNTGTWRSSGREKPKFLVGSSLKKWAVYLLGVRQPLPDENLGRKFVMRMLEEARARAP